MNNFKKIILLSVSIVSMSFGAGTTAAQWLELETGIRGVGMGGAPTAAGRDISSSFRYCIIFTYICFSYVLSNNIRGYQ